jgi:hypothetical protein
MWVGARNRVSALNLGEDAPDSARNPVSEGFGANGWAKILIKIEPYSGSSPN